MRRLQDYLIEVGYWLAALYLLAGAGGLFWLVFVRPRPSGLDLSWGLTLWGTVGLYVAGSLALLLGLYFLQQIWSAHLRRRRFRHEGAGGPIEVSPLAIRDFIEALLAQEGDLLRHRILLGHAREGIDVTVNARLRLGVPVVETAQRLQRLLKEQVESRIGVRVHRVTVYAQSIGGLRPKAKEPDKLEPESTPTPTPTPTPTSTAPSRLPPVGPEPEPEPSPEGEGEGKGEEEGGLR